MSKHNLKDSAEYRSQITGSAFAKPPMWRRLRRWLADYRWLLIGCMWIVAIALGYIGFSKYSLAIGEIRSPWDTLYRTLQLFVLESGAVSGPISWELQVARFLAPVMAVYTALQTLAIILHEQLPHLDSVWQNMIKCRNYESR